jgi:cellulose synthase/poly-beta-1,6-N-acetylglucosamine synthase-like glycosyltransferase
VQVIANRENLGFAAGNNQGLALANGNYLLLLNNDTVVTEGWLARMLSVFERYMEVGIVGPVSNYVSGPQQVPGASYQGLEEMHHFAKQWSVERMGQTLEVTRAVGFCLLAKREVIDRIGGLDEQFGSGNFEDDDFCLRAAAAGYKARIAQDAFIHHTGSQTFLGAGINYKQSLERNWEIFKTKWKLPASIPYGANCTLYFDTKDLSQYYVPLPPRTGIPLTIKTTPAEKAEGAVTPMDRLKKMAQAELTVGNWEQAIQLLTEALNLDQTSESLVSLWNDLGYCYFMANLPREAESAFDDGLKINPDNLDLLTNLASLYLHQEDYTRATEYVNRALRLAPHDEGALRALGDCAIKLARFDVALGAYDRGHRPSDSRPGPIGQRRNRQNRLHFQDHLTVRERGRFMTSGNSTFLMDYLKMSFRWIGNFRGIIRNRISG